MYTQTNLSLRLLSIVDPTRESIYLNTALTSGHVQQHQHVIEVQLVQLNGCDQQIGTNGLHALNVVLKGLLVLNPSNQSFKVSAYLVLGGSASPCRRLMRRLFWRQTEEMTNLSYKSKKNNKMNGNLQLNNVCLCGILARVGGGLKFDV